MGRDILWVQYESRSLPEPSFELPGDAYCPVSSALVYHQCPVFYIGWGESFTLVLCNLKSQQHRTDKSLDCLLRDSKLEEVVAAASKVGTV